MNNKSSTVLAPPGLLYRLKSGKSGGLVYIIKINIQSPAFPTF